MIEQGEKRGQYKMVTIPYHSSIVCLPPNAPRSCLIFSKAYLTTYSLWSAMHELSLLLNYQVFR